MRKLITVLLTAILTASLSALPCLAEVSVQKENEEPKETTAETSTKLTSFDGGPMVEYRGEGFKIQFDTGETKAPFLDSDKREVIDIVSRAEQGRMSEDENKLLTEIANANGEPDLASARIYPIHFEGNIKLDRNIRVIFYLPDNALDGGYDFDLFRIRDDGTVEYLKDAELDCFADGSVGYIRHISFKIREFSTSTFFTAKKGLDLSRFLNGSNAEEYKTDMTAITSETTRETRASDSTSPAVPPVESRPEDGGYTLLTVVLAAAGGVVLGSLVTLVIMKRKK